MHLQELKSYAEKFREYTELRVQENRALRLTLINGNVVGNVRTSQSGVAARVFKQGKWGFACHPDVNNSTIGQVIDRATANADFLGSKENLPTVTLPGRPGEIIRDHVYANPRLTQKELIEFLREVDDHIIGKYPDLKSRNVTLSTLEMEKTLLTTDGSAAFTLVPRALVSTVMSLEKDGKPVELYEVYGGFGFFEDNFRQPDELYAKLEEQYRHLKNKSTGIYPEAGEHDCILGPDLAGILSHEAIGHTVEADIVLGGSIAADHLNQLVATPALTMIDFAHTALGRTCPVPVYMDDEGIIAEDAVLIKEGILKTFMNNRETAAHYGVRPTGNARAYAFSDEPLIRMRNTAILPGDDKLADMIASIDKGYYLMKASNGEADSTSEFMFGVVQGYEIEKGRLERAILDTTISGVAFDMLKTISMISDDMVWGCSGMCGKKQVIPVGMGGPAVKCRIRIGGK
ncbi:MAG: TldD/PmbA family protein [Candidatus Cloacimonetes bacterium]|nr:TldD/PmbA family protein [Candidatus Cloacimonadota bacterium]